MISSEGSNMCKLAKADDKREDIGWNPGVRWAMSARRTKGWVGTAMMCGRGSIP